MILRRRHRFLLFIGVLVLLAVAAARIRHDLLGHASGDLMVKIGMRFSRMRGEGSPPCQPETFDDPFACKLMDAVAAGQIAVASRYASQIGGGFNVCSHEGKSALLFAVMRENAHMVKALLARGAQPDGCPGHAPIAFTVRYRDLTILKILLAAGADPNGKFMSTPALSEATTFMNDDAIDVLVAAKARLDEADVLGGIPVLHAAIRGHWSGAKKLLDYGSPLSTTDQGGLTIGDFAYTDRLLSSSPQGRVRDEIIERWKAAGLGWPPLPPDKVQDAVAHGQWPPPGAILSPPGGRPRQAFLNSPPPPARRCR